MYTIKIIKCTSLQIDYLKSYILKTRCSKNLRLYPLSCRIQIILTTIDQYKVVRIRYHNMTATTSPIDFFSPLTDPRVEHTQNHSLDSFLFISLCAVFCGTESWNEIEDYGNAKLDWLEKSLDLPNFIPLHDTFNRVISMMDPKELNGSFLEWEKSIAELTDGEIITIDGKCLRESSNEGTSFSVCSQISEIKM